MIRDFESLSVVTSRGMANSILRIHCIQCGSDLAIVASSVQVGEFKLGGCTRAASRIARGGRRIRKIGFYSLIL